LPLRVDEAVECAAQALAHRTAVVRHERDRCRFESRFVVMLEEAGNQARDRMIAEIR